MLPPAGHLPFSSCAASSLFGNAQLQVMIGIFSLSVCPCKLSMSGCYRLLSERGEGGTALRCFRDTARDVQPGHRRTASIHSSHCWPLDVDSSLQ